ncbi:MAG TPA: hypothetical protein VF824_15335 [Thermoanaerobaculia bacterium]|jgi:hypothetical protein
MKQHRFELALVVTVAAMLFLPALVTGHVFTLRDHFDYFQPLRWFTAQELRAGYLPLWNPYNASGEPWLANPQTGVFYPPAWLFVVLPFATAYMLFLFAHVALLGCGAYLFFARNASRGAAMAGAVALMLSGPVLSLLDINNNLATFAWIPLALWCAAEGAWRRGAFALALAFLGGEPFFAAIGALLYVLIGRKTHVLKAGVAAFGISAIQLFPFLASLRGSDRAAGLDAAQILRDSMPLRDWLRVAIPPSLDASALDPHLGQHFIPVVYTGVAVAALALLGIRRRTAGWVALLIAVAAVAAGPRLLLMMPVTFFRYPSRLVPFGALAIAALMTAGWDRVRTDKRWLDLLLVCVIAGDLVWHTRALLRTAPFDPHPVPYDAALASDSKFLRAGNIEPRHRAAWISGYLNLYDHRYDSFTAAPVVAERYARMHRALLERPTLNALATLSAGFVITKFPLAPPMQRVARAGGVDVYANPFAWPLASYASGRVVQGVMYELGTSRARVVVDTPHPALVVLTQQDGPGWSLRIDGKSAKTRLISGLFRGADVPAGHHEILWSYRAPGLFGGAAMTLVTLLTMQLDVFVKRRRGRKFLFVSLES